jgi:hypothetical protein
VNKIDNVEGIKTKKDGKQYVSNPYLLQEIIKSKEQDELTPEALKMFDLMIENISAKKHYNDPEDRKDCWQSAYLDILMYWRGFNPEKGKNPFAYFTSIIVNGLNKGWHKISGRMKPSDMIVCRNALTICHSLRT